MALGGVPKYRGSQTLRVDHDIPHIGDHKEYISIMSVGTVPNYREP